VSSDGDDGDDGDIHDGEFGPIDEVVHGPVRLRVLAYLSTAGTTGFPELRRRLGATDGNLTVHLRRLAEAGYVTVDKRGTGRASTTRVTLTAAGRAAFLAYLDTMTRLANRIRAAGPDRPAGRNRR
jgi:DNA-binding MarR family transcriptional regulator